MSRKESYALGAALSAIIGAAIQLIAVFATLGLIIDIGFAGFEATGLILLGLIAALVISTIVVAAVFCKKRLSLGLSIALIVLMSATLILLIVGLVSADEIGFLDIISFVAIFSGICMLIMYFCTKHTIPSKPMEIFELQNQNSNKNENAVQEKEANQNVEISQNPETSPNEEQSQNEETKSKTE